MEEQIRMEKKILNQTSCQTPKSLGFHMPAEWESQEAICLSWPKNKETWMHHLSAVQEIFIQFVFHLHTGQKVFILVDDKKTEQLITKRLQENKINLSQITFFQLKTIDSWMRDIGPTFLVGKKTKEGAKERAMVEWIYNAWGNKYDDLLPDTGLPERMNQFPLLKYLKRFEPKIVLEGGSIEVNGNGTCLTTKQCLLNKNRNPQLSQTEIEEYLKEYLGLSQVIWLNEGIVGDDTDGHIDDLSRFVNKTTILTAYEDDQADENYLILDENYKLLKKAKDLDGKPFTIIKLPMPGKLIEEGRRMPASYANFYIGNKAVIVPIFGHKNDEKALKILQNCFPDRKVVGINCVPLVYGFGTLHCISQQLPCG